MHMLVGISELSIFVFFSCHSSSAPSLACRNMVMTHIKYTAIDSMAFWIDSMSDFIARQSHLFISTSSVAGFPLFSDHNCWPCFRLLRCTLTMIGCCLALCICMSLNCMFCRPGIWICSVQVQLAFQTIYVHSLALSTVCMKMMHKSRQITHQLKFTCHCVCLTADCFCFLIHTATHWQSSQLLEELLAMICFSLSLKVLGLHTSVKIGEFSFFLTVMVCTCPVWLWPSSCSRYPDAYLKMETIP